MPRFNRTTALLILAAALIAAPACNTTTPAASDAAPTPAGAPTNAAAERVAVLEKLTPSYVRVEYTLQLDKGNWPSTHYGESPQSVITQERPLELNGLLIAANRVLTPDPMIHPRFIKSVAVRFGNQSVAATPAGYALDHDAVILQLASPLPGTTPVKFDTSAKPPYYAVDYDFNNARWVLGIEPANTGIAIDEFARTYRQLQYNQLIVDKSGLAVGYKLRRNTPADDSWKTDPSTWKLLTREQLTADLAQLEKTTNACIPRVNLSFRSPPKQPGRSQRYSRYSDDGEETERNVMGVLLDSTTVLILAPMDAKTTARLERIRVYTPSGEILPARFAFSLKDYGALVAKLEKPTQGAPAFWSGKLDDLENHLLLSAEINIRGEQRFAYFNRSRMSGMYIARKRQVFPVFALDDGSFVFDTTGKLVALPTQTRAKPGAEEGRYAGERNVHVPLSFLGDFSHPDSISDPNNVPLTEEQENRLAWLGAELQPMDAELARSNNIADQTNDGSSGAIVTFIYPDSPAAKAGLKTGDVLLRIYPDDYPKPIELQMHDTGIGIENFPWEDYDRAPEQAFDRIPAPWGTTENTLTRTLTDLGVGKKYDLELVHDGKTVRIPLVVTWGPTHFLSSPKYKSVPLGITVRDLTYEVRRYVKMKPEDPGLVLARIEVGSKASTAGLKPYEIVTAVNDKPVNSVKDFENAVKDGGELRLSIKRMSRGRIVKITLPSANDSATTKPADKPEPEHATDPD